MQQRKIGPRAPGSQQDYYPDEHSVLGMLPFPLSPARLSMIRLRLTSVIQKALLRERTLGPETCSNEAAAR